MTGSFIAFEGGEGCGKSTQASRLAEALGALLTREPGGTVIGERLRDLVLDPAVTAMADRTEALIMAAARAQHVAQVITPTLATGQHVVTDRFLASSVAYQGYGRGLDPGEIRDLSLWATHGLQPHLTILLDVPDDVAEARLGPDRDRMEQAGAPFHRAVANGFRVQAADDPDHWVVIDGAAPVEDVGRAVRAAVADRLGI